MFENMEKIAMLKNEGYKMVGHGSVKERIEQGGVEQYNGELGTGYIVKYSSFDLYPAEYYFYEVYAK